MSTFLTTCKRTKTKRVPCWFMRQAGRYLPEYRELRSHKGGFLDMVYDPKAACEVTMQPIRRFGMDAAILFSDILVIPQIMGQPLEFIPGQGPSLEPVRDGKALAGLTEKPDILNPIYETIANVRGALKDEGFDDTALIGFAGSPWTVACYVTQGQGSKDFKETKIAAYGDPVFFKDLIDQITTHTADYLIKQIEAGAQAVQLFDSWAGLADADQFNRWVIQPTAEIVRRVRNKYPDTPIIGFPKQGGLHTVRYIRQTGIDVVGLGSEIDPAWAAETLQDLAVVQGNLDPYCLFAGGDQMRRAAENILETLGAGPLIFNLGHGINKDTPIEHVEQLVKIIRDFEKP